MHSLPAFGSEKGCLRFTAAKIGVLGRAMSTEVSHSRRLKTTSRPFLFNPVINPFGLGVITEIHPRTTPPFWILGLDHSPANGVPHQAGRSVDLQFAHEPGSV